MFSLCCPKKKYLLISEDDETIDESFQFPEKTASNIRFSDFLNDVLYDENENKDTVFSHLVVNFYNIEQIFNKFENEHPNETETENYLRYKRNVVTKANEILDLMENAARDQNGSLSIEHIAKIQELLPDFVKTAQNHTSIWKQIGKFMCYIVAGTMIAWTIGIAIPTIIGIKLLTGSWVLNNFFHAANYMFMIPKGQVAIALCTTASFYYPVSRLLNWMSKPTPAQTVAEKINPQLDGIKRLLQPGSSSLVAH